MLKVILIIAGIYTLGVILTKTMDLILRLAIYGSSNKVVSTDFDKLAYIPLVNLYFSTLFLVSSALGIATCGWTDYAEGIREAVNDGVIVKDDDQ